jgi:hypothetical protein
MALQNLARIDRAGRVVGRNDDHGARARRDELGQGVEVGQPVELWAARVVNGLAVVEMGCGGPQRVVRAWHQHLVALVEQRAQGEEDQLADAVAHEDVVGGGVHHAAVLLLHDHGFASREDALLVAVGVGFAQVFDHRLTHGFGRAKAEGARGCRC